MKALTFACVCSLLLAACGDDTTDQRGSVGWDTPEAQLVIRGEGDFTLELEIEGRVSVSLQDEDGTAPRVLDPGTSYRMRASGARTLRLRTSGSGHAQVRYRFQAPSGTTIDPQVP